MSNIKLFSKDRKIIEVPKEKTLEFVTLKNLINDLELEEDTRIPIEYDEYIVKLIFEYLVKKEDKYVVELPEKMEDNTIFSMMIAVNYLDNENFIDCLAQKVADIIKSYDDVQALRDRFGIECDFEKEELEQIQRETEALKDM